MVFATLALLGAFGADQGLLTYFADLSNGTNWCFSTDWTSSHARLADPIGPMAFLKNGRSQLTNWMVQSVLPIAIYRLLHGLYPLASASRVAFVQRSAQPDL